MFCHRHSIRLRLAGMLGPGVSIAAFVGLQRYPLPQQYSSTGAIILIGWFVAGLVCCLLGTVFREDRRNSDTLALECFAFVVMSILVAVPVAGSLFALDYLMHREAAVEEYDGGYR